METCELSASENVQNMDKTLNPVGAETATERMNENSSDEERVNYGKMTKTELVAALSALLDDASSKDIKDEVAAIKHAFFSIRKVEIEKEKQVFLEKGNEEAAFAVMPDVEENALKDLLGKYKDIRAAQQEALEAAMKENLTKKQSILSEMNEIISDPDNVNRQYQRFQQLQQEFKSVGDVPPTAERDLWKDLQSATENFYDLCKMNKELRDYDFKKNLEIKQSLCSEAESLAEEPDVIVAFNKLQELHNQWREVGPVAKELREDLWHRFKDASTVVNKKHQAFFEQRKEQEKTNEVAKIALCDEAQAIDIKTLTSFKSWDEATKSIIALQERWKTLGFASKKVNNELFVRFRQICDAFFSAKAEFFKTMKEEIAKNVAKKHELCERAEALKESTEWKKTAEELIALQKEWKAVGPIPKKTGDALWKRFKETCDYFFDKRNSNAFNTKQTERENLAKKRDVIERIKGVDEALSKEDIRTLLRELSNEFLNAGHVPFKEKDKVYDEYKLALNDAYKKFDLNDKKSRMTKFANELESITDDKQKLLRERERLVRIYEQRKSEVKTFENNLGFFNATSKSGSNVLKEMEHRIEKLKDELTSLEQKIELIDQNL